MKSLALFLEFSKFSMKTTLQSPVGIGFFLFGKIMRFVLFFLFIYFLIKNTRQLAGYNLNQTMIFFLTYSIIDTLAQMLFREVYKFRSLIVNGELDSVLIKPYHPFLRVLVGGVDISDLIILIPYIGITLYFISQTGTTIVGSIFYLLLVCNAMVIMTAFHIIVLAFGILTTEVDHAHFIMRDITRMAAMPIDIYKDPLRTVLVFVVPIGIMMTFPVKALLGLLSWPMIGLSFMVGCAFLAGSLYLWDYSLKKYQSWGG